MKESTPEGLTIEFCPEERDGAWMTGFMKLNTVGQVREIRWEIQSKGELYSGGVATFPIPGPSPVSRQFFLPDWSRTWRSTGREDWQGMRTFTFIDTSFLMWWIDGREVF